VVNGLAYTQPTNLALQKVTMNVLLGPTLSGKTTLMRLMAGPDAPTTGRILWHGQNVTGQFVQDRKVAMVCQQFTNYPGMSVYDNIASPLRLIGKSRAEIDRAGCGKTTLLNIISGLLRPSQGRVLFGETDVTDAPTATRNIAQVFQFPVVYATMTLR